MGGVLFNNEIDSDITFDFTKTNLVTSDVTTTTDVQGLQAQANAFSDALGFENAFVEADSFTQIDADGFIAEAAASSFAAGDGEGNGDPGGEPLFETINLAIIQDATGSTDEDWVDASDMPVADAAFAGQAFDANPGVPSRPPEGGVDGPADERDVQDAIIGGIRNLLLTLAADLEQRITVEPLLDITLNVELIKHFDQDSILTLAQPFSITARGALAEGIIGSPGDIQSGDGEADFLALFAPIFDDLADTGSNGATEFNDAYEEAVDFFNTVPSGPDPSPDSFLVQLTDVDEFDLTATENASISALEGLEASIGLDTEVFIIENASTDVAAAEPEARLSEVDTDGMLTIVASLDEVSII